MHAGRLYRSTAPALVPIFVVAFIVLRELLLVVLTLDLPPVGLLLGVTFVQALLPAIVGSLLVASAVLVLTEQARRVGEAWRSLADRRPDVYRAARWSAGLALVATITLGPVGVLIQPMLLGPPLVIHEIVLKRHQISLAWQRAREMMATDSRPLVYMLAVPAAVGLLLIAVLRGFGFFASDAPSVARGVAFFALQGAFIGAAIPFTTAVALICYFELDTLLGGQETR